MPTAPKQKLTYVDLDFSYGIVGDLYASAGLKSAPSGAATLNTYGCFSPPSGGLAPLPAASTDAVNGTWALTPAEIVGGTATRPTYLPPSSDATRGYGRAFLLDARVHGPVTPFENTNGGQKTTDVPIATYGYLYDPAGTSASTSYAPTQSFAYRVPGNTVHITTQSMGSKGVSLLTVPPSSIDITTSAAGGGYIPVVAAILGCFYKGGGNAYFSTYYALPNTSSTTSTTPYSDDFTGGGGVSGKLPPFWLFTHQGRTIFILEDQTSYDFTSEGQSAGPERLYYTPYGVTHPTTAQIAGPLVVSEENPSGYGTWASVSASELLLVKHRGGGIVIRGDIANPTVLRVPGIQSTGGIHAIGCHVPSVGFVYGTRAGVFAWTGAYNRGGLSDVSNALSDELPPNFWISNKNWPAALQGAEARAAVGGGTNRNIYGWYSLAGRFAFSYPFVFAPNGFVLDTRPNRNNPQRPVGGWWQMEAPSTTVPALTHWDISARANTVYGFREYIDDTHTNAMTAYDLDTGGTSYYYESQPLVPSRNHYVECRELTVSCIASSVLATLDITVTGLDDAGHTAIFQTSNITFTDTNITVKRFNLGVTATQVQVQITANGTDAAAPRVLGLSVGMDEQGLV